MQRQLLLDIIVSQSAPILQLFAREDQALLVRRNAFLLDLLLDSLDGVRDLHVGSDSDLQPFGLLVGSLSGWLAAKIFLWQKASYRFKNSKIEKKIGILLNPLVNYPGSSQGEVRVCLRSK